MKQIFISLLIAAFIISCGQTQKEEKTIAPSIAKKVDYSKLEPKADTVIQATFKALSSALGSAMKEGGVKHAVSFCNVEATPIADSLSKQFGVRVSRVSDRPRNPANQATEYEKSFMSEYRDAMEQGVDIGYEYYEGNGIPTLYKPIALKGLCLNCHGKAGQTMKEEDIAFIQSLYPEDKAVGYEEGELRGMWKVEMVNATK